MLFRSPRETSFFTEAARLLRKSEAAVKMLVSRGLQDLRERTSLALEVEQ